MTKLKSLVTHSDVRRGPGATAEELLSVSIHRGVVPRTAETDDAPRADDLSNYKSVRAGDLVLNRMRAFQGAVGIARRPGIVSPDYTVLRPHPHVEARYLHHLFRSRWFVGEMVARLRGIGSTDTGSVRTPRINWDDLRDIDLVMPSIDSQRAVADYLDLETARIDALISKKQRLLELLDDRLAAARQSAVLRDFNPLSGDGLLPAGWTQVQLGVLIELQRGHDLPADQRVDGLYPVVSSGGVSGSHHRFACRGPAVITGRYGTVGGVFYVEENCWPLNTTLYVKDFRGNDPRWVALVLRCLPLDAESEKSAVGGINRNVIGKLRVPRPPLLEQHGIVRSVAAVEESVATAVRAVRQQLDLLAEHRQALITAAVTGQITVPGVA